MTLGTETNSQPYTAAGTLNENFPTVFTFFDTSDVVVYHDDVLQVLGTNYTVSGGSGLAGTVIWVGSPTAGKSVDVIRRRPSTQGQVYTENDPFPSKAHENTVDKLAMALNTALRLKVGAANTFTALDLRISDVATPTLATDAVNKAYADALSIPSVTIPTPADPADDGEVLEALAGAYVLALPAWVTGDLPLAGDTGRVLTATGAGTHAWQALPATVNPPPVENFILNGQMQILQRLPEESTFSAATTPNNTDGNYLLDCWALLSDAGDAVDVTQSTVTPPPNAKYSMRAIVQNAGKFGYVQHIEHARTLQIVGDDATTRISLQFKARTTTGAAISNLRCAILPWLGLADSPTRDVVANWSPAGTDPLFAASYGVPENTPADLALVVDTWTTFKIENVLMDQALTTRNIAIFIWTDDVAAVADDLFITDVQLNTGATARDFIRNTKAQDLIDCQRFSYVILAGVAGDPLAVGYARTLNRAEFMGVFPVEMRVDPLLTFHSAVNYNIRHEGVTDVVTLLTSSRVSRKTFLVVADVAGTPLTIGTGAILASDTGINAKLMFSADL